ncbi:MAG: synthase delta subunit [Verrucomicrobiota bacterium]|jgi:F0F1-type ATP synthase delta subunit|nr:synthase delta subunit [Verrucomicrobiota bacterium]MDK2963138.1 synthase delta subunit [Verrucomicrobiota bacterium]
MKLTRQHRRKARLLWQTVLVNGVPDGDRIREAVRVVQRHGGRDTEAVLKCFVQRLEVYIRSNQVRVISADDLSPRQQEELVAPFRGTEAATIGILFVSDPSVIGGLRVEQGYQVTDLTVTRQLELLQDRLLSN